MGNAMWCWVCSERAPYGQINVWYSGIEGGFADSSPNPYTPTTKESLKQIADLKDKLRKIGLLK